MKINAIAISIIIGMLIQIIGWNSYFIYRDLKRKRDKK